MFSFFRKKSQVEALIASDGLEHAVDRFAEIVARKLPSREVAYRFILEELDGARMGNAASQKFARSSGIAEEEYRGALDRSAPEIDGPDGPQQLVLGLSLEISDRNQMAEFRCRIGDKIMRKFNLGKYGDAEEGNLRLLQRLGELLLNDKDVMPALTSSIPAPASAPLRHIHNREKNIASAKELLGNLTRATCKSADEVLRAALRAKADGASPNGAIEKKQGEIANAVCAAVNQHGLNMIDHAGAIAMVSETMEKLSEAEVIACDTRVASLFVLAHVADSAYQDGDRALAVHISRQCKPIAGEIMKVPNDRYTDIEATMVDSAFDVMKKVDGHA